MQVAEKTLVAVMMVAALVKDTEALTSNFGQKMANLSEPQLDYRKLQDRNMATDEILRRQQNMPSGVDDDLMRWQMETVSRMDLCPAGAGSLECQRKYALRGADECADGGMCVVCRQCGLLNPISWPVCCKNHAHCCRSIARACQRCDVIELWSFCQHTFNTCHYHALRK